jgi:hypothetical protein
VKSDALIVLSPYVGNDDVDVARESKEERGRSEVVHVRVQEILAWHARGGSAHT